jgi:hypothetical protein
MYFQLDHRRKGNNGLTMKTIANNGRVPYVAVRLRLRCDFSGLPRRVIKDAHQGSGGIFVNVISFAKKLSNLAGAKVFKSVLQAG